jgi:hypothetical protein
MEEPLIRERDVVADNVLVALSDAAEHALLEMRDRFDLKRGDSVSLDALEDAIARTRSLPERPRTEQETYDNSASPSADDRIVLLADELNRLAMAVESLAAITPHTEREYARARRQEAREMARATREGVAELIPE